MDNDNPQIAQKKNAFRVIFRNKAMPVCDAGHFQSRIVPAIDLADAIARVREKFPYAEFDEGHSVGETL